MNARTLLFVPLLISACSDWPTEPRANIPVGMLGRWGLVAADCTTQMGDDKGLLTINETGLKFYESRAQVARIIRKTTSELTAEFSFSGEGMNWSRVITLRLVDADHLVRIEYGADATPEPLTYAACV